MLGFFLQVGTSHGIDNPKVPSVGNHVPPLEFQDLSATEHKIDWISRTAKATVVFFFEPRSVESFKEISFFDTLSRKAEDSGLKVYAIEGSGLDLMETGKAIQRYRQLYSEPSFPLISDPEYSLSTVFGVQHLPSTFLMESHGVIISRGDGFTDFLAIELTRKIERLLKVDTGALSFALRDIGVAEEAEREYEKLAGLEKDSSPANRARGGRFGVGNSVPEFEFVDLQGTARTWSPSPDENRLTVVFFWGALCLPCIREMAFLDSVAVKTRALGLEVIAVEATGLRAERTAQVMWRYQRFHPPPSFHIVPDPGFQLSHMFGVGKKLPETFFIDNKGVVTYQTNEFIQGHEKDLIKKIEMALKLEPDSLEELDSVANALNSSAPTVEEAPTVQESLKKKETFRSNLIQGDSYYNDWEFAKALPHYLQCLELQPDHASLRERVARIYQRQGDPENALLHWEKVLEIEPDHPLARERIDRLRQ